MRVLGDCGVSRVMTAVLVAAFMSWVPIVFAAEESRAVAQVGKDAITLGDFESYLTYRPPAQGKISRKGLEQRLEEMISTELLYREALRKEIDRIPDIARSIRQLLVQRLLDEEVGRPVYERAIEEGELKAWYEEHSADYNRPEQVRLTDIFFAAPESGSAAVRQEKRKEAEEVLGKALALQDTRFGFGELVLGHSDTHGNYPRGDTGFFGRDGWPVGIHTSLAEAAFAIGKVGMVAGNVVETPEGYHVVMLVGRRAAESRAFEEMERDIERRIRRAEIDEARRKYLADLREKAGVRIDDESLDALLMEMKEEEARRVERIRAVKGKSGGTSAPPMPGEKK
jgi:peptidyl-prolyl cis-trans isomerase C